MAKFRAWDKKNKSFITNDDEFKEYMIGLDGKFYRMDFYSGVSGHEDGNLIWNELEDIILMQYTGLKDKNDKEVYEGDIIRIKPNPKDYGGYKGHNYIEYVFWNDEEACYDIANDRTWLLLKSDIEIIGNIYEHKYLLDNK